MGTLQPTDAEMETAPLIYAMLCTPESTRPNTSIWHNVVTIGNGDFKEWYREAMQEAVAAYEGDPSLIEVKYVERPPMASPLIADFFVNLGPVFATFALNVAASAAWDGFKLGHHIVKAALNRRLVEAGIPPEALRLRLSPAELEELAISYVRSHGHPRAELTKKRELFNTVFSGGYPFRIDATLPQGWEIAVSTRRVTYTFVVDSLASVLHATRQEGRECVDLSITSLLEDTEGGHRRSRR